MRAEDLKKNFFGDFIKWLDEKKINDHFSMDIWMSKVWDIVYGQYCKEVQQENQLEDLLHKLPLGILENLVKKKRDIIAESEKKLSEQLKKEKEKESKPDISLVKPDGTDLKKEG